MKKETERKLVREDAQPDLQCLLLNEKKLGQGGGCSQTFKRNRETCQWRLCWHARHGGQNNSAANKLAVTEATCRGTKETAVGDTILLQK